MFRLREQLITDYAEYIRSFLKVRDPEIREWLEAEIDAGVLWPEPLLSLNPTFRQGPLIDDLVERGLLHPLCGGIFRRGKSEADPTGLPLRLHRHQEEALERAQAGRNYVLTTGTGSGKSLGYILPIVDTVLKEGSGRGVRAVVVYPMNALANSQLGELQKYLGLLRPAVTFARYTGQEDSEERDRVTASPPDIILTNFMMLELMLSRPFEKKLIDAMDRLRFLVLDELHTYRGRQGADVALLIRRVRQRTGAARMQCVGTSATMATDGTAAERRRAVAEVAAKLFGAPVEAEDIIGEKLVRLSPELDAAPDRSLAELRSGLRTPVAADPAAFKDHPLTRWLESQIGLAHNDEGDLVRARPRPISGASGVGALLGGAVGIPAEEAGEVVGAHLMTASRLQPDPVTGSKPFAFRLHQFLSPGLGVFSTLDTGSERYLSLDGQRSAPGDPTRILFPLAFCRVCGQHYHVVARPTREDREDLLLPRELRDVLPTPGRTAGFLFIPGEEGFPDLDSLIPEDWYDETPRGRKLKKNRSDYLPQPILVEPGGTVGAGLEAWLLKAPLILCVQCRESYSPKEKDYTKLSTLGQQGRSTATTTLSLSTLAYLREGDRFQESARKLLSFTDNRQDASLQAGHLNDFVEVATLRAALFAAARAVGEVGLSYEDVTLAVERQLDLQQDEFALQPTNLPSQIEARRKALREVLGYRIYRDLRRGWRVNAPNLEQVGLIRIDYPDLAYICATENYWNGAHQALLTAAPAVREAICRELLERMRRRLAISVRYLRPDDQEAIRNASQRLLREPWGLAHDEGSRMDAASYAWIEPSRSSDSRSDLLLTPASGFAHFLRQTSTFDGKSRRLTRDDVAAVIDDLLGILTATALIAESRPGKNGAAYQVNAEVIRFIAAEPSHEHRRTHNAFFERFYRERAVKIKGMFAREHTAQVSTEERMEREKEFREGRLPILYCSPTMELGVDIADLNVVNLRNVPPTPANYAQRSGRAGRSGQPALVFTYCTAGSPHDQYYFRRPESMVSGAVTPPRLDVANEDLVRAHVHAIWLGRSGEDLGQSLADKVLDVFGDSPSLMLREEMLNRLRDPAVRAATRRDAESLLNAVGAELSKTLWYSETWLDEVLAQLELTLDRSCDRWRNLYRSAREQHSVQTRIILDNSVAEPQKQIARALRSEAEKQMDLLTSVESAAYSDFYVYRYLASEGFLPGYNFPRLPLSAYLPGERRRSDYLSRPRFLAISEFGPGAVVYHEGSRYLVDRVMLPAGSVQDGGKVVTAGARLCASCGYLHVGPGAQTADICERCANPFGAEAVMDNLFRLESVSLRRRDRITCDEEERMRQGYELRTGIRFKGRAGEEECVRADVVGKRGLLASLTYAQAATIWRVNVGWNRRKDRERLGYVLDYRKGRWVASEGDAVNELMDPPDSEMAETTQRVIPYVEDRRNALIFEWGSPLAFEEAASLQAALKSAIQQVYQLEDNELAAEPLPGPELRRSILFYEAAEGGAGVLHRLIDDRHALRDVACAALKLCHYDPSTLDDLGKAPGAKDNCSTACYDCLMSYGNQRDHPLLDRTRVVELLAALRDGEVQASGGPEPRPLRLKRLLQQCGSELEAAWLQLLEEKGLHLPTQAQFRIKTDQFDTLPDFVYACGATRVAVYIDGPSHDFPARQSRDAEKENALLCAGWVVHRFHHREDWEKRLREYPSVYGELQ